MTLDSPASHFTIELGTKRNAVQLSFILSGVVSALSRACSLASTLGCTVLEFCIIIVLFRSQNILDLLRTKSSWKTLADDPPPLPCFYPHSEWAA